LFNFQISDNTLPVVTNSDKVKVYIIRYQQVVSTTDNSDCVIWCPVTIIVMSAHKPLATVDHDMKSLLRLIHFHMFNVVTNYDILRCDNLAYNIAHCLAQPLPIPIVALIFRPMVLVVWV